MKRSVCKWQVCLLIVNECYHDSFILSHTRKYAGYVEQTSGRYKWLEQQSPCSCSVNFHMILQLQLHPLPLGLTEDVFLYMTVSMHYDQVMIPMPVCVICQSMSMPSYNDVMYITIEDKITEVF